MSVNLETYTRIRTELQASNTTLVAVSKIKPVADIMALYDQGQRDFGENYVQELLEKQAALPADIRWHFIGHLQSNKVKYIAPFVHLIHGVDSVKLLREVGRQGLKNNRVIPVLLQVHIAKEETKFGLDAETLEQLMASLQQDALPGAYITGLMGMASFSEDKDLVSAEFQYLKAIFTRHEGSFQKEIAEKMPEAGMAPVLSMGMSDDYPLAIDCGSNLVRIGSLLFGRRS